MIFIAWYFTWWQKCQMKSWIWVLTGFEISDVLSINDKDYSITFGLYFSVEWMEPRLNLSKELWGEENVAGEDDLVPGECIHHNTKGSLNYNICNWASNFSQPGVDKKPLDSQYFHLQPKDIQNNWRPLQTCRSLDRLQEEDLLQPGHQHHLHLPHVVWLLPLGYPEVQISGESGMLFSDNVKTFFGRSAATPTTWPAWCSMSLPWATSRIPSPSSWTMRSSSRTWRRMTEYLRLELLETFHWLALKWWEIFCNTEGQFRNLCKL